MSDRNSQAGSPPRRGVRWKPSAGATLTLVALLIWVLIHADYGMTCDEPVQTAYGEAVRNYLAGNLSYADFSRLPDLPDNIYYYEPALDLACVAVAHALHADIFAVRHGLQGLFWVALFYPGCALGRRLGGRLGAWFAGLALLGTPALLGNGFNNPKDLPLACAALWWTYALAVVAEKKRLGWPEAVKLGGAAGFLLMIRPGAWFLCAPLGLLPFAAALRARNISGHWQRKEFLQSIPILAAALVMAWALMVLPWPTAWHAPIGQPIAAANFAAHFDQVYPVLLRGTVVHSNQLPGNYLATYLVLTLPIPLLVLAAWGNVVLWRKMSTCVARAVAVVALWFGFWFPMLAFVLFRPNVYDGLRHFLFILPPVAVLAGVAATEVARRLRGPAGIRVPALGALVLSAVPTLIGLHPYENVYYNFLAGPRANLRENYETDYWFSSYREAAEWINGAQSRSDRPLRVLVSVAPTYAPVFDHYLNPRTRSVVAGFHDWADDPLPANYDYYVANVRYFQWLNFSNAPVAYRVQRDGITLTVIRGRSHNLEP